jgi:ornithine--oxo-acid transaminase
MYPVSCVLGRKDVMLTIEPGTHGSTYGGNPLGCAVAIRALEVVQEEQMVERAEKLGQLFRKGLEDLKSPLIETVRGKGLLNAIVIDETKTNGHSAWDLCMLMKTKGLLVRVRHYLYVLKASLWGQANGESLAGQAYSPEHHPPGSTIGYHRGGDRKGPGHHQRGRERAPHPEGQG